MANGTPRFAPVTNIRLMCRTAPVASDSGPTMKPGVSQKNTTGMSNASHSCKNRAALSAAGVSMAPPRCAGLFAAMPSGRPSTRASAVIMPEAEAAPELQHGTCVAQRVDHAAHVVRAHPVLGNEMAQRPLVGAVPLGRRRRGSTPRYCFATRTASASSRTSTSITPLAVCTLLGPIAAGSYTPSPPPSIIAGPPMPILESTVAMMTSQQPSSAALPAKQYPDVMPTSGTSPLSRAK